ncbi:hypothetical protein D9M68_681290 [compost metagenome]
MPGLRVVVQVGDVLGEDAALDPGGQVLHLDPQLAAEARLDPGYRVELPGIALLGDEQAVVGRVVGHPFEALVVGAEVDAQGEELRVLLVDGLARLLGQSEEQQLLRVLVSDHHPAAAHIGQAFHVLETHQGVLGADHAFPVQRDQLGRRRIGDGQQALFVRVVVDGREVVGDARYGPRFDIHPVIRQPDAVTGPLLGIEAAGDVEPGPLVPVEHGRRQARGDHHRQRQAAQAPGA